MSDDATRAIAALEAAQHRAFTRQQAAAHRFDHRRIATAKRAGWLEEVLPGVLVMTGSAPTWQQRLMVLALAGGGQAVVSHRAAARLHRLDGFDHAGMAVVEASVTRAFRVRVPDAVVHHVTPLDQRDVTVIGGLPCTTVARTLADLGSVVRDRRRVSQALTDARRRHIDLLELRSTAERLHRPGQSGTGTLLRLLDAVPNEGRVPESWFEELLAICLDSPRLPPLVRQHPILDPNGRVVARVDLAFPSVKLGLEAHSRRFHFGRIDTSLAALARVPRWPWRADARPYSTRSLRHERSAASLSRCVRRTRRATSAVGGVSSRRGYPPPELTVRRRESGRRRRAPRGPWR